MRLTDRLKQFVAHWTGRWCSGYSDRGGQCIDLARRFLEEFCGGAYNGIPSVRAAKDMYRAASSRKFRRVRYKPGMAAPAWALAIFDGHDRNPWGHVAITLPGSTRHVLKTFDCNWSRPGRCSREEHRYDRDRVIGWLVPRAGLG